MADARKFCGECFLQAPPDWNKRYCPSCGGRIKLQLVKKRYASQGRPRMPDEDERRKKRKPRSIKLSRKLAKQDSFSISAAREKSVLGPRFHVLLPGALFIQNILSFGLRSTFWVMNRTKPLFMMASPEERNIKTTLSLWIASFVAYFALSAFVVSDILARDAGITADLTESIPLRAAAVMFVISFVINRHILFWIREIIIDELRTSELDAISSRALSFAPSPILIWFVGIPYIQHHINRMIKKRGLSTYKSSRNLRVKKPPEEEGNNNILPDPPVRA